MSQNWKVYKSNLDSAVTVKFTSLLVTTLNSLGYIFKHIQPTYGGLAGLIDEVLGATYSVFHLCPVPTIQCIQKVEGNYLLQLLKLSKLASCNKLLTSFYRC